jgi:hypothetical protein
MTKKKSISDKKGKLVRVPLSKIEVPPNVKLDPRVVAEWEEAFRTNSWKPLSPYSIFVDVTRLGFGEQAEYFKRRIEQHCEERGFIACIDFHEELGWLFHTMFQPDGSMMRKETVWHWLKSKTSYTPAPANETKIKNQLADRLRQEGRTVQTEVRCEAGVADIVTEEAVYEIKWEFNRSKLYEAIGQVLLYRQAIDPSLRAVVVGKKPKATDWKAAIKHAKALGVEVVFWTEEIPS